jgi:hypothetical protein
MRVDMKIKRFRFTTNLKMTFFIATFAAVLIIIVFSFNTHKSSNDPNDILRIEVARGVRENIAKLTSAVLVWDYERKSYGPLINQPGIKGNYKLWWNKGKTAISCEITLTSKSPNGQVASSQKKTFMTYDGKKFLEARLPTGTSGNAEIVIQKNPEYTNENYLQTIGWQGIGLLTVNTDEKLRKHMSPGIEEWTVIDGNDSGKLIKHEFHNSKTGQIGITYYDPKQGFGILRHESYASKGHFQYRDTFRYSQVSGGAWFPIEYNSTNFNIQNGEIIAQSKTKINLEKSVFNNPSAIPKDIFEYKIGPNDEVFDATSLKMRIKRFPDNL